MFDLFSFNPFEVIFNVVGTVFNAIAIVLGIVSLYTYIMTSLVLYKLFKKVGINGVFAFIPICNVFNLCKIFWGNGAKFLYLLIPIVNIYFTFKLWIDVAHAFGESTSFGVGLALLLPIFSSILVFGNVNPIDNISYMQQGNNQGYAQSNQVYVQPQQNNVMYNQPVIPQPYQQMQNNQVYMQPQNNNQGYMQSQQNNQVYTQSQNNNHGYMQPQSNIQQGNQPIIPEPYHEPKNPNVYGARPVYPQQNNQNRH